MTQRITGLSDALGGNLLRAGAGSAFLKMSNVGLQFLLTITLARFLGVEGFGTYTYVIALLTILSIPAQMGIPTLVIRMTASYMVDGRYDLIKGIWRRATQGVLAVSVAIAIAVGGFVVLFPDAGSEQLRATLLIGVLLVPLKALGELRGAALRGLHHVVLGQLPDLLIRPLLHFGLVVYLVLLGPELWRTASGAMTANVVAATVAFVAGAMILLRTMPAEIGENQPEYETSIWLASVVPLSLLAGTKVILGNTDIVMIGAIAGESATALFKVAEQASALALISVQVVTLAIGPHIARLYREGDTDTLQRVVRVAAWVTLSFAVFMAIVLIVAGEWILRFIFGPEFTSAYTAMVILCIGVTTKVVAGPATVLLNMSGHERDTLKGVAIAALTNVVLNAVLIPYYGIIGAAVASSTAFVVWTILLSGLAYKRTGINTMVFGRRHSQ